MSRPVTLFTGQWADLPFEQVCSFASRWGYDGLEIACWGDHLDVYRAVEDDAYVATPGKYGLGVWRSASISRARRFALNVPLETREDGRSRGSEVAGCGAVIRDYGLLGPGRVIRTPRQGTP